MNILCYTEEAANEVLQILHNQGYKWNGGGSLIIYNNWSFKDFIVYITNEETKTVSTKFLNLMSNKEELTKAVEFLTLNRKMGDLKIDENTVVHCETKELVKQVLKIADSLGYKWNDDTSYLDLSLWDKYREDTCYNFHRGNFGKLDDFKSFYKIISAQEFIDLHKTSSSVGVDFHNKIQKQLDEGYKESNGKRYYELDWNFINQMADRMSQNKKPYGKYDRWNWKKPIDIEGLKQATMRHLIEVIKGNYEDEGRPYGHLEAIADNCMMINYQLNKIEEELEGFNKE